MSWKKEIVTDPEFLRLLRGEVPMGYVNDKPMYFNPEDHKDEDGNYCIAVWEDD